MFDLEMGECYVPARTSQIERERGTYIASSYKIRE